MNPAVKFQGKYVITCRDRQGRVKWIERINNGITNAWLNDVLDVQVGAGTQKTMWYFGLIDSSGYTAVSADDTISSHSGWTENENYTAGTRPQWVNGSASSQSITTSTVTSLTASADSTIRGIFLVSDSQKGGTNGLLMSTALFDSSRAFNSGESWEITSYTLKAAG